MSTLVCITNDIPGVRACVTKDQHGANCDGWAYQLTQSGEHLATGKECKGCLPRRAARGLLCWPCWENLEQALADWPRFADTIARIKRAVQRDNGGVRSSAEGHVNLAGTFLAVDECESYLASCGASAELWASTVDGAKDAIRFARAAHTAFRTHPIEEKPHPVRRVRCTKCEQLTLVWHPTPQFGGEVTVVCDNTECGAQLDQAAFEQVAAIEEQGR